MATWKYSRKYRGEWTLYGIFKDYTDRCMKWSEETGWVQSTIDKKERYLCNDLLVHVRNHNEKPATDYTREEMEEILSFARRKAAEKYSGEILVERMTEYRNVLRSITYAVHVLNFGDDVLADETTKGKKKTVKVEKNVIRFRKLPKSMTPSEEIHAVLKTVFCMDREFKPGMRSSMQGSYAAYFTMLIAGVRNGEAAGLCFRDLHEIKNHPGRYYLTVLQSVKHDTNEGQVGGKTSNVYRKVVIPQKAAEILLELKRQREIELKQSPYAGQYSVEDLPIGRHSINDLITRCDQGDISRAGREILNASGIENEDLYMLARKLMLEEELRKELDLTDSYEEIECEPTAYLARRHFATILSILGFSDLQIRYMMGHDLDENFIRRKDFSDDELYDMSLKMDQRAIYNNIMLKDSYTMKAGEKLCVMQDGAISLEVPMEDAEHIVIEAETLHMDDKIDLEVQTEKNCSASMQMINSFSVEQYGASQDITLLRCYQKDYEKEGANNIFFRNTNDISGSISS